MNAELYTKIAKFELKDSKFKLNHIKFKASQATDKVLVDEKNGKILDWRGKKMQNLKLSDSYRRLGLITKNGKMRSEKLQNCGVYLTFKKFDNDTKKLNEAYFCKDRLCPTCTWRRSLKIFGQTSKIMKRYKEEFPTDRFLFLTLTIRNCKAEELNESITELLKGFNRLFKYKRVDSVVRGFMRGLEVTYNSKDNTFHPHIHCVFSVSSSYFKTKYITQQEWTNLWKKALNVYYTPILDIRAVRSYSSKKFEQVIAEISKYATKDLEFLLNDKEKTDYIVYHLRQALAFRRLTSYGKAFKLIHKELNLDDAEDGDLICNDIDDEIDENGELVYIIEKYLWRFGLSNYYLIKEKKE